MKRVLVAVVVVALVAGGIGAVALALLAGSDSSGSSSTSQAVPTTTPEPSATRPPTRGLARFYSQHLDWSSCQGGFLCSTLTVPLDYRHPDGRTIDLVAPLPKDFRAALNMLGKYGR